MIDSNYQKGCFDDTSSDILVQVLVFCPALRVCRSLGLGESPMIQYSL